MDDDDPFKTTPLTGALHEAMDAARNVLVERGFEIRGVVIVAEAGHEAAPQFNRAAVAYPMDEWDGHLALLADAQHVFEFARGRPDAHAP